MKSQQKNTLFEEVAREIFNRATYKGKYKNAVLEMERLIKKYPNEKSSIVFYQMGFLYDHLALNQKGKMQRLSEERALQSYKKSLEYDPNNYFSIWGIGRVWWHRKDKRAIGYAKQAYKMAKKISKEGGAFAQSVGVVYEVLDNDKRAEYWYLKSVKEEKRKASGSYANIIEFYKKKGNIKEVRHYAKKMEKLYARESEDFKKTSFGKHLLKILNSVKKEAGS